MASRPSWNACVLSYNVYGKIALQFPVERIRAVFACHPLELYGDQAFLFKSLVPTSPVICLSECLTEMQPYSYLGVSAGDVSPLLKRSKAARKWGEH